MIIIIQWDIGKIKIKIGVNKMKLLELANKLEELNKETIKI